MLLLILLMMQTRVSTPCISTGDAEMRTQQPHHSELRRTHYKPGSRTSSTYIHTESRETRKRYGGAQAHTRTERPIAAPLSENPPDNLETLHVEQLPFGHQFFHP